VATIRSRSRCWTPLAAPRDALGEQTYESLARRGETMTTAVMVAYVADQIDQARTELEESRNFVSVVSQSARRYDGHR
jgi:hypothetical protein